MGSGVDFIMTLRKDPKARRVSERGGSVDFDPERGSDSEVDEEAWCPRCADYCAVVRFETRDSEYCSRCGSRK
jgi:hypothetical protein